MSNFDCIGIERPQTIVYGNIPDAPMVISATRSVVFTRYRAEYIDQNGEHAVMYDDASDLLEPAFRCAQTILNNECPYFVAAHTKRGPTRVVARDIVENAKWAKYTQIIGTQS